MIFDLINKWSFPCYICKSSLVLIQIRLFNWCRFCIFRLPYNMTSNELWSCYVTFDLINKSSLPLYICKPGLVSIALQLFNWGQLYIFSQFRYWSQMTFDIGMWPLTSSTNDGYHVAPMTQVWEISVKELWKYTMGNVNLFSHNRQQPTKQSLCILSAKAGNTKIGASTCPTMFRFAMQSPTNFPC